MANVRVRVVGSLEKVDAGALSYREFADRYMRPNVPVVLKGITGWRAAADWVNPDGKPNLSFLASRFPSTLLPVVDCSRAEDMDQRTLNMSMEDFINQWPNTSETDCVKISDQGLFVSSLLYLKDWHFVKEYPDYKAYTTPLFFVDDWLNLYLDSHSMQRDADISQKADVNCSDYRFVYMGPKGTWTPLHADVFRSYSWSANVCGRKLWLLLDPSQSYMLFDRNLRSTVYDVNEVVSEKKFPHFHKAEWIECIQEKNEVIFVPSGWYHQVHNLEDTISINHNWFNSCNLTWVWNLLLEDYKVAKEFIEDIRDISDDFEGLCQRNLAANSGMNFYDFFIFITRFALANIVKLCHSLLKEDNAPKLSNDDHYFIDNLAAIRLVASKMKSEEAFLAENLSIFCDIKAVLREENFQKLLLALSKTHELISNGMECPENEPDDKACLSINYASLGCSVVDCIAAAKVSQICSPDDLVVLIDSLIDYIPSSEMWMKRLWTESG